MQKRKNSIKNTLALISLFYFFTCCGVEPSITNNHWLLLEQGIGNYLPILDPLLCNPHTHPQAQQLSARYLGKALVHATLAGRQEFIAPLFQYPHSHKIPFRYLERALLMAAAEYGDPKITALLLDPQINPRAGEIPLTTILELTFLGGNYPHREIARLLLTHPHAHQMSFELLEQISAYATQENHTEVVAAVTKVREANGDLFPSTPTNIPS